MSLLGDFRSLDRRVFILAAARMVVTLGFAAVLPYLGVVLHQERQVPATVIGVIWTVAGLSASSCAPRSSATTAGSTSGTCSS